MPNLGECFCQLTNISLIHPRRYHLKIDYLGDVKVMLSYSAFNKLDGGHIVLLSFEAQNLCAALELESRDKMRLDGFIGVGLLLIYHYI